MLAKAVPDVPIGIVDPVRRNQVEAELERILASPEFRTSKRSQEFLRYIVITALDGRIEELKERIIGTQVFQRAPDYDTGEHSIVRVKANELRKRLAQFYGESTEKSPVEIQLPRGSYTPDFYWAETLEQNTFPKEAESIAALAASHSRLWPILGIVVVALIVFADWHFLQAGLVLGSEERFWQPMLQAEEQPILCVADPEVLRPKDSYHIEEPHADPASIPPTELMWDHNHYIGWGDARALSDLSTFLNLHHRNPDIRMANDVSFTELSKSPAVLIGATSNPWTVQLANNFRYYFVRNANESSIRDRNDPNKKWTYQTGPPKVDYLLVTRVFESKTGQMIVLAAGLSHNGTQVAGEVLTSPDYMNNALAHAPADWEKRNMQLVFRVEIFGNTVGSPTLEASTFW